MSTYNITVPAPDPDIVVEIGAGATTIAELTDKATIDLPTINTPLSEALAAKANTEDLGTAAAADIGTTAGTVAAGDDSRLSDARTPTSHTHVSADIADATPNNTPSTVVLRDGNGQAAFGDSGNGFSGQGLAGYSYSGDGVYGNSMSGYGVNANSVSSSGVNASSTSGSGVSASSSSGSGATATSTSGTYHQEFGNSANNRSFVARLLGAFGWFRGIHNLTVSAVDTLTANRVQRFQDKDGAIAVIAGITTDATGARTLALTDSGEYIRLTHAAANALTIPTNAAVAFPVGTEIYIRRGTSAGAVTLSNAGVTVNGGANVSSVGQSGNFALKKIATDEWDFI